MFVEVRRRQVQRLRLRHLSSGVQGARLVKRRLRSVPRRLRVVLKRQSREFLYFFVIIRHEQIVRDDVVHRLVVRVVHESALEQAHGRSDGIQVLLTTNVMQAQFAQRQTEHGFDVALIQLEHARKRKLRRLEVAQLVLARPDPQTHRCGRGRKRAKCAFVPRQRVLVSLLLIQ